MPRLLADRKVSDAVRRLNPTLFAPPSTITPAAPSERAKIINQKSNDGMNKTERLFHSYMEGRGEPVEREPITFLISNGVRYTPDFARWVDGRLICYETKGGFMRDDAIVKIKVAASRFPQVKFFLVQKRPGRTVWADAWKWQEMTP